MPTQLIAGDNQNEASFAGGNDGTLEVRIGPAGSKATGLSVSSVGDVAALGKLTQKGGAPVPRMLLLPAKATTSGTFIDFSSTDGTSIPSWAKKVTVTITGVSGSGTSIQVLQLGTSAGFVVSGYSGTAGAMQGINNSSTSASNTNGVLLNAMASEAANNYGGTVVITNSGGNLWSIAGSLVGNTTSRVITTVSSLTLPAILDRIRLTTVNGTDTFDAGSISILVEGYE